MSDSEEEDVVEPEKVAWYQLNGEEIFDKISKRGNKLNLGNPIRAILKDLIAKKRISKNVGKVLAKNKNEKASQRIYFGAITDEGLAYLRDELTKALTKATLANSSTQVLRPEEYSANVRARIIHLAVDIEPQKLLEKIFGGVTKEERRANLVIDL